MNKKEGFLQAIKAFSVLSGLGVYLAVTVGFTMFIGSLFDDCFDTHPYGIFSGIILGFPIAVYGLYGRLKAYLK